MGAAEEKIQIGVRIDEALLSKVKSIAPSENLSEIIRQGLSKHVSGAHKISPPKLSYESESAKSKRVNLKIGSQEYEAAQRAAYQFDGVGGLVREILKDFVRTRKTE